MFVASSSSSCSTHLLWSVSTAHATGISPPCWVWELWAPRGATSLLKIRGEITASMLITWEKFLNSLKGYRKKKKPTAYWMSWCCVQPVYRSYRVARCHVWVGSMCLLGHVSQEIVGQIHCLLSYYTSEDRRRRRRNLVFGYFYIQQD